MLQIICLRVCCRRQLYKAPKLHPCQIPLSTACALPTGPSLTYTRTLRLSFSNWAIKFDKGDKDRDPELAKPRHMIDNCGVAISERPMADFGTKDIEQDLATDGSHSQLQIRLW